MKRDLLILAVLSVFTLLAFAVCPASARMLDDDTSPPGYFDDDTAVDDDGSPIPKVIPPTTFRGLIVNGATALRAVVFGSDKLLAASATTAAEIAALHGKLIPNWRGYSSGDSPSSAAEGDQYYQTSLLEWCVYSAGAWHCAHLGCDSATCSAGCCNGGVGGICVPYASENYSYCGTGGASCTTCSSTQICTAGGVCVTGCDSTQCTGTKCCDVLGVGGVCRTRSNAYCGASGGLCVNCTTVGEECVSGTCTCDVTSCPTGCCDGGGCEAGTSNTTCGTGGAACVNCTSTGDVCTAHACVAPSDDDTTP